VKPSSMVMNTTGAVVFTWFTTGARGPGGTVVVVVGGAVLAVVVLDPPPARPDPARGRAVRACDDAQPPATRQLSRRSSAGRRSGWSTTALWRLDAYAGAT
jgi:hypothetical protein